MDCLVVSSTALRAQLLAGLLSQCCPVTIAAACDSAVVAITAIERSRPELVILDRDGETDDCQRIARHLIGTCATARLILLSSDPRLDPLQSELASVIDRVGTWQALLRSVRACEPASRRPTALLDPFPDASLFERLRPRERAVLELIGAGLASRDIAIGLGVSLQTVETYRKHLSAKLGVSGARLVRIAVLYSCLSVARLRCPPHGLDDHGQRDHGHGLLPPLQDLPETCHRSVADVARVSEA